MGLFKFKEIFRNCFVKLLILLLLILLCSLMVFAVPDTTLTVNSDINSITYMGNVTFNILFDHNYTDDLNNLIINDTLPSGWSYISNSLVVEGNSSSLTYIGTSSNPTWQLDTLSNNSVLNITFQAYSGCNPTNSSINNVNLTYGWDIDSVPQNNVTVSENSNPLTVYVPNLILTYSPLPQVSNLNEQDLWQVVLYNNGTGSANNIKVNHQLEEGFNSATFSSFSNGSISYSGVSIDNNHSVNWTVNVPVGEYFSTSIYATPSTCDESLLDFNLSIVAGDQSCPYFSNTTQGATNLRRIRITSGDYNAPIGQDKSHSIHVNVDCDTYNNFTLIENRPINKQVWLSNVSSTTGDLSNSYSNNGTHFSWFFYNSSGEDLIPPFDFWITYTEFLYDTISNFDSHVVQNYFSTNYYNNSNLLTSFYDSDSAETTTTSSSVSNTVLEPSLNIEKIASDSVVSINEIFNYDINILNEGSSPAYNISITDLLPDGTFFINSTQSLILQSGRNLGWNVGFIDAFDSWSTTVTAQVNETYESGELVLSNDTLSNNVEATYHSYNQTLAATYDGTVREYSGDTFENVKVQPPPLILTKDKATATIGELITYTIEASFVGAPANSVVLTNTLPSGLQYVNYSSINGDFDFVKAGQNLIFDYGNITDRLVYSLEITAYIDNVTTNNVSDTLTNNVQLVYENSTSGSTFVITDSTSSVITEPIISPSKSTNQSTVNINDSFTYTITLNNVGGSLAYNISVGDTLPDGMYLVNASKSLYQQNGRELLWEVPTISALSSWNVILTCKINETYESGEFISANDYFLNQVNINYSSYNKSIASSYGGDIRIYQNNASQSNTVIIPTLELNVDKNIATIGELLTYHLYTNFNKSYADSVLINYTLPSGLVYVTQTNNSLNNYSFIQNDQQLLFNFGDISNRETILLTITGYINNTVSNTAGNILSSQVELTYQNSSSSSFSLTNGANTTITEPSDNIQKVANVSIVSINKTFSYNISFTNNGTSAGYNLLINDTFPDGISYISSTQSILSQNNQSIVWLIPYLSHNDIWSSIVVAKVNETYNSGEYVLANDTLFNQVEINYSSYNSSLSGGYNGTIRTYSSSDNEVVTINDPTFTLSQSNSVLSYGDSLIYTINSDFTQSPANNFIVNDTLSSILSFVNYSSTGGSINYSTIGNKLIFDYGDLTERQNYGLTINTCVNGSGSISNNATFHYENSSTDVTFLINKNLVATASEPSITVTNTILSGNNSGLLQIVQYLLNITNNGGADAHNLFISNTFDDGLIFNNTNLEYDSFDITSRIINWTNITVSASTSQLIYLNLTLNSNYTNGTLIEGGDSFINNATGYYYSSNSTSCLSYIKNYDFSESSLLTAGYIIESLPSLRKIMRTSNFGINSEEKRELNVQNITFGKGLFGTSGNLIAKISFNYTSDINLSAVSSDLDLSQKKAFIHGLSSVDNVVSKSLYIPRVSNSGQVYVCPGASSLEATTPTCDNKVTIGVNQTGSGMTVTETTVDGEDYYLVTNIQGTGGGEGNAPNLTNPAVNPASGSYDSLYRFNVTYIDAENDVASYVILEFDGASNYSMSETDAGDSNVIDGKLYHYDFLGNELGEGNHTFKFYAADEANVSVNTTLLSGPEVTINANLDLDLTSGSQQTCSNILFYVNYTNLTGEAITPSADSGNCKITITSISITNVSMSFNSLTQLYYYSNSDFEGTNSHAWSVICDSDSYDQLNEQSSLWISNSCVPEFNDITTFLLLTLVISGFVWFRKNN